MIISMCPFRVRGGARYLSSGDQVVLDHPLQVELSKGTAPLLLEACFPPQYSDAARTNRRYGV